MGGGGGFWGWVGGGLWVVGWCMTLNIVYGRNYCCTKLPLFCPNVFQTKSKNFAILNESQKKIFVVVWYCPILVAALLANIVC